MWKKPLTVAMFLLLIGVLAVACNERQPPGIPPTNTPVPATTDAAATEPSTTAVVVLPSTPSPTTTTTLTATATVTATLPPEVVALQALNIRSGPGEDHPIVGWLASGAWTVIGRSADGLWWQIECPPGTPSEACWITASEEGTQAVDATAAPVAAAPPQPAATVAPTATPCVVSPGAGWTSYQVVAGDTLSSIASSTGASVGELMAANCLSSDAIVAGSSLWAPGRGGTAPTSVSSSDARALVGVEAVLPFVSPEDRVCPTPLDAPAVSTPTLFVGINAVEARESWHIGEDVCIYAFGFDPVQPVTVTVAPPAGLASHSTPQSNVNAIWWAFVPLPDIPNDPSTGYVVTATQPGIQAVASFTVTKDRLERVNVVRSSYAMGDTVQVVLSGVVGPRQLFLYRLHNDGSVREWRRLERDLPLALPNRDRTALIEFETDGLESGDYLVHTGAYVEFSKEDPRAFSLTP